MQAPNWEKPFRCHIDASAVDVGGTLTQLDDQGSDRVVAYFSKRLNSAEENYTANNREILGLVYLLKIFRCYLEGTSFEVITDNRALKYFFRKATLSRREARWLEFLSHFGITYLNLQNGKLHVLGDVMSTPPPTAPDMTVLTINNIQFASFDIPGN